MSTDLNYLVAEDSIIAFEGIEERMEPFRQWRSCGFAPHIDTVKDCINEFRPALIFLDWSLQGGNAFDVLQHISVICGYTPYIIFNTGYQNEQPDIPQELFNKYTVDKYLLKPIWKQLRENLEVFLKEAEAKASGHCAKESRVWLKDVSGDYRQVDIQSIICIIQHHHLPRCKRLFTIGSNIPLDIPLVWAKCIEILEEHNINYFIPKNRESLVVKKYIQSFERPYIRLFNFPLKVEVVKENTREFEAWLTGECATKT